MPRGGSKVKIWAQAQVEMEALAQVEKEVDAEASGTPP